MKRAWRYVPPNLVTASSLVIATVATQQAMAGRPIAAAWLALICVITDKLDGLLAAALRASSEFGVQLDSLGDLAAFGVAPATIYYAYFHARPELGWSGAGLAAPCALHVTAVAVRLARFNVQAPGAKRERHYFGIPSTMTAGTLLALLLFAIKYGTREAVDPWPILPISTGALLRVTPFAFVLGAIGMLSPLRVPKVGRTKSRLLDVLELAGIALGVAAIVLRRLPEYLVATTIVYLVVCAIYHLRTEPPRAEAVG